MGPVTRTDVVIGSRVESACRPQKAIDRPNRRALCLPAQNERLVIRIGKPAATADRDCRISLHIVFAAALCTRDIFRHGGGANRNNDLPAASVAAAGVAVFALSFGLGALLLRPTEFLGGSDASPAFR